jgi:phosphopantetheinyl transferase
MQAVESQTLILYHTDLRGQWPEEAARKLAAQLPYERRRTLSGTSERVRASLAGIALALRALTRLLGQRPAARELHFAQDQKPRLRGAEVGAAEFSIAHSGPWAACAALARGRVGLDLEMGREARILEWVRREALLKGRGVGVRQLHALTPLEPIAGELAWDAERWQVRHLAQFEGASGCVVADVPLGELELHRVQLPELFSS